MECSWASSMPRAPGHEPESPLPLNVRATGLAVHLRGQCAVIDAPDRGTRFTGNRDGALRFR